MFSIEDRNYGKKQYRIGRKDKVYRARENSVQIAEEIDTTKAYVNRVIKKKDGVVNKTFVQMMEALGCDVELTYVKREG